MIKHNTQAAENKVTDDFSKHFRSETSRFLTPETKLHSLITLQETTWWGDNHPVTKACGRENKEEKKN